MPSETDTGNLSEFLLVQLGVGHVGAAVVSAVQRMATAWSERFGLSVQYYALANSSGIVVPDPAERLISPETLAAIVDARRNGQSLNTLPNRRPTEDWQAILAQAMQAAGRPERVIVVDCAVGRSTTETLLAARAAGAHIVLCNKDPLTGLYTEFRRLQGDSSRGSLHLSATVGAGLPITSVVTAAYASGDHIIELQAVASGSLGQLCSTMSQGVDFHDAMALAIAAGYCEPDPRIDLSGHDVARKLLILARLGGYRAELADIEVESLTPSGAAALSREAFLAALQSWREHLRERFARARASSRALRYVGVMDARSHLRAGLREVDEDDPIAQGHGPRNVFVLRTERCQQHPLVIAGPGAGINVTAGAVVGDILRAAGAL